MKVSIIRKSLIKQSAVALILLMLSYGVVWYVESLNYENDKSINYLRMQVDNLTRQSIDLSSEYSKVTNIIDEYNEIKNKQENNRLDVNKLVLRNVMASARSKYYLDNMEVKMDEIKPLDDNQYKRDSVFVEYSNVSVKANSLSDSDVFGLIQELQNYFVGVKVISLRIKRLKELDEPSLIAIKDTGFTPMVESNFTFTLFGLRSVQAVQSELSIDGNISDSSASGINGMRLR